jgi:hypothetical protein
VAVKSENIRVDAFRYIEKDLGTDSSILLNMLDKIVDFIGNIHEQLKPNCP